MSEQSQWLTTDMPLEKSSVDFRNQFTYQTVKNLSKISHKL